MPEFLAGYPLHIIFMILTVAVWIRGHVVYSVFRAATEFTLKRSCPKNPFLAKVHKKLSDGSADYGVRIIQKWGLIAVPLAYLTIGVQTAILGGAGVLKIDRLKFGLAQIPGCLAWAAIYSTIGFALWSLMFKQAAASPLGVAVIILLILGIGAICIYNRNKKKKQKSSISQ